MTKEELIKEYVANYPSIFFKILSLRYPFSKEEILSYEHILDLGGDGIQFNPYVDFDDSLREFFGERLWLIRGAHKFEEFASIEEYKAKWAAIDVYNSLDKFGMTTYLEEYKDLYKGRNFFNVEEIDLEYLKKHGEKLNGWHWRFISLNYKHKIDYEFLTTFSDKLKQNIILTHPNVDWTDVRVFNLLATSKHIRSYWLPYEIGLKPLMKSELIVEIIDYCIKYLPKKIKITWGKDEKQKYLIKVYVYGKGDNQCILDGYFYSRISVKINTEILLSEDISVNQSNHIITFTKNGELINPFDC